MSLSTQASRLSQYDPADAAQNDFDTILGRLFGGRVMDAGNGHTPYGVDVREDADHIYVEAELPGFSKEDVEITTENSTLTLTAQHKAQTAEGEAAKGEYLLRERRFAGMQRSFKLPRTVDEQTVKAALADGVLTITLNKREETKPRKVPVS